LIQKILELVNVIFVDFFNLQKYSKKGKQMRKAEELIKNSKSTLTISWDLNNYTFLACCPGLCGISARGGYPEDALKNLIDDLDQFLSMVDDINDKDKNK
jgi:hypothetical protein